MQRAGEFLDFALCTIAVPTILFLQLAREVLGIAFADIEHVVGQVTPTRLHLALQLRPLALDDVFIHAVCSSWEFAHRERCPSTMHMDAFAWDHDRVSGRYYLNEWAKHARANR